MCNFQAMDGDEAALEEHMDNHQEESGHILSKQGPYYEAGGNTKWACGICGDFAHVQASKVKSHIEEDHEPSRFFLQKTGIQPEQAEINAAVKE